MNTCVILPTYNEASNIDAVLKGILAHPVDVLVVDDNSPDGTAARVRQHKAFGKKVHLLTGKKKGLGVAYRRGFSWALQRNYDAVFEMDADLSHDPARIPVFLEEIGRADVIIGSRYVRGGKIVGWSAHRRLISWGANTLVHILLGLPVCDATSGFRCIRMSILRRYLSSFTGEGYGFQISILFAARNCRVREIPICFRDRRKGKSKLGAHDIVGFIGILLRLFVQRFS